MSGYDIFTACFPQLGYSRDIFEQLSQINDGVTIFAENSTGFVQVQENFVRLICVLPEARGCGVGRELLRAAEKLIGERYDRAVIGGESSQLFMGATDESRGFFEKCGYEISGRFEEMSRTVQDFSASEHHIPVPNGASFGWYSGTEEPLLRAVAEVDKDWVGYFRGAEVFCGYYEGEVACFCIVEPDSVCLISDGESKVGVIGCVGTVPRFRRNGMGLKMVALAMEELKKQGCGKCFIHYTAVAHWYARLGFRTFLGQSFASKML